MPFYSYYFLTTPGKQPQKDIYSFKLLHYIVYKVNVERNTKGKTLAESLRCEFLTRTFDIVI